MVVRTGCLPAGLRTAAHRLGQRRSPLGVAPHGQRPVLGQPRVVRPAVRVCELTAKHPGLRRTPQPRPLGEQRLARTGRTQPPALRPELVGVQDLPVAPDHQDTVGQMPGLDVRERRG